MKKRTLTIPPRQPLGLASQGVTADGGALCFKNKHSFIDLSLQDAAQGVLLRLRLCVRRRLLPEYFDGTPEEMEGFTGEVGEVLHTVKTNVLGSANACLGFLHREKGADIFWDVFGLEALSAGFALPYDTDIVLTLCMQDDGAQLRADFSGETQIKTFDSSRLLLPLHKLGCGFSGRLYEFSLSSDVPFCPLPPKSREAYMGRGSHRLLKTGMVLNGWCAGEETGEAIESKHVRELGLTGLTYINFPKAYNTELHRVCPELYWSLALAPSGQSMWGKPLDRDTPPYDFFTSEQRKNLSMLRAVCFGDEEYFTAERVEAFAEWFGWMKAHYPHVLVHNNVYMDEFTEHQFRYYLRAAKPDLLTFDHYHYCENSSPNEFAAVVDATNDVRLVALEGEDGTGRIPLPFGQYLQGFATGARGALPGSYVMTDSQIRLVVSLSLCMGAKWFGIFRLQYGQKGLTLFDGRRPTESFGSYKRAFASVKKLESFLLPAVSDRLAVVTGFNTQNGLRAANRSCETVREFGAETSPYVESIEARPGEGGAGDLLFGSFKFFSDIGTDELPPGVGRRAYMFMLVNGKAVGSSAESAQDIQITFKNTEDKEVSIFDEEANRLQIVAGRTLRLRIGGGCARLFIIQ